MDDDVFMLEVVSKLLRLTKRYEVVGECGDAASAIRDCPNLNPDLVLLDINLPDSSGIASVPQLAHLCPRIRVLLCTGQASDERIMEALRSGAHGFVEKTGKWNELVTAIDRVAAGEHYFCPRSTAALAHHSRNITKNVTGDALKLSLLSSREVDVLHRVSRGESSKEIADHFKISRGTVDVYRSRLMRKLGVKNIAELVAFVFRSGFLK